MAIRTIKLPYETDEISKIEIERYIKNYNSVLRFTYNRLLDYEFKLSTREITTLQKTMKNVFIDSHFLNSAQQEAKQLKGKDKVIFGGKFNFLQRCRGKISQEEFQRNRLVPIYSIGEADKLGNRKFRILSENTIRFQPCKKVHCELKLPNLRNNLKSDIQQLLKLQNCRKMPITYKLSSDCIYIIFEENFLNEFVYADKVENRVFSIDLNPNYIGWSVVDWADAETYTVVDSGVVSIKQINDADCAIHEASNSSRRQYISNKRTFENTDTAKYLADTALHYQCQLFSIEKLEIKTKDNKLGKSYNRLVNNQWNRFIFYTRLQKYCDRYGIRFQEVVANYSSFEGNLIYRETGLPDMCLSSIELGRRAYEFYHQYVVKDKPKESNIMIDTSSKAHDRIVQSLEELHYDLVFDSIISLYNQIKTRNLKYRVQLEDSILTAVSSKKSIKSKVLLYSS